MNPSLGQSLVGAIPRWGNPLWLPFRAKNDLYIPTWGHPSLGQSLVVALQN